MHKVMRFWRSQIINLFLRRHIVYFRFDKDNKHNSPAMKRYIRKLLRFYPVADVPFSNLHIPVWFLPKGRSEKTKENRPEQTSTIDIYKSVKFINFGNLNASVGQLIKDPYCRHMSKCFWGLTAGRNWPTLGKFTYPSWWPHTISHTCRLRNRTQVLAVRGRGVNHSGS